MDDNIKLKIPVRIPFIDITEINFKHLFQKYDEIKISEEKGDCGTVKYIELLSIRKNEI